jgi:hypothetical protein
MLAATDLARTCFCADVPGPYSVTFADGSASGEVSLKIVVITPAEALPPLVAAIVALGPDNDGTITVEEMGSLLRKLIFAQSQLDRENPSASLLLLAAFNEEIVGLLDEGVLRASEIAAVLETLEAVTEALINPCAEYALPGFSLPTPPPGDAGGAVIPTSYRRKLDGGRPAPL